MLVFPGGKAAPVVIDYREKAPLAAHKTMFTHEDSWYSHKAVGVPGTVRGLALAHKRFGKLPWKTVVAPAVKLAEDGFALDAYMDESLIALVATSPELSELRRVFGKEGKAACAGGDRLMQKDLGRTLRRIAEQGPDGFYKGATAELLVAEMKRGGGLPTRKDLADYRAKEREPLHGHQAHGRADRQKPVVSPEMRQHLRHAPMDAVLLMAGRRLEHGPPCRDGDPGQMEAERERPPVEHGIHGPGHRGRLLAGVDRRVPQHGERQDDVTVLAADVQVAKHIIGDAPDQGDDLAMLSTVHAGLLKA